MGSPASAPSSCRLRFLGGAAVDCSGCIECHRIGAPRQLAFLALLATIPQGLCRARLLALLWPDADEKRGRHQLSDTIYFVRHAFGHGALREAGDCMSLDPAIVPSDVGAFQAAVAAGRLREAVGLWNGPFLDGFNPRCGYAFEEWQEAERQRLEAELVRLLEQLAGEAEAAGDLTTACRWWSEATRQAPFSAHALEGFLQILVRSGDEALALHHYGEYADRLRRELEVAPEARLQNLAARIRGRLAGT